MATFWKDIKNKYSVKTYEDTKKSHDWVIKALQKATFDCSDLKSDFLFTVSGILCSCKGVEEFTENAFGYTDFRLNHIYISFWPKDYGHVSISIEHDNQVSISTESRIMLEEIITLLEKTSIDEEQGDHTSVIRVKMDDDFSIKQFFAGIVQNIASNFIWYLLTLLAGGLLAYFMTH